MSDTTDPLRSEDCSTDSSIVDAPVTSSSDEDLLAELFPEVKLESTQKSEVKSHAKECEVEWALMALEEHEQRSPCATAANADAAFVSLFEEMYGSDTTITLSTPPPPTKPTGPRQESFRLLSNEKMETAVSDDDEVCSTPNLVEGIDGKIHPEALEMLRLVHQKPSR